MKVSSLSRVALLLALSRFALADEPVRRLLLPLPHNGAIQVMAFNPSGTRLASADDNGLIKVWNWKTHAPEISLAPARGEERQISWTAWVDDSTLAVQRADNQLRVYDVATGKEQVRIAGYGRNAPTVLPGGKLAVLSEPTQYAHDVQSAQIQTEGLIQTAGGASGSDPGPVIQVLNASDGKLVRTLQIPSVPKSDQAWVRVLAATADGSRVCYGVDPIGGTGPKSLVEADAATGAQLRTVSLGDNYVPEHLIYSADGKTVLGWTGSYVTVWGPEGVRVVHLDRSGIAGATFGAHGEIEIMVTNGGGFLYSLAPGATTATLVRQVERGAGSVAPVLSPEGQIVITQGTKLLDATTEKDVVQSPGLNRVRALLFHPSGRLLTGLNDGSVLVWDLSQGKLERRFSLPGAVRGMALTADCTRLAVTSVGDDQVRIFDWKSGKLQTSFEAPGAKGGGYVLRFSPDAQTLAVLTRDPRTWADSMRFFNPRNGEEVWKTEHTDCVTFSPTGQRFAYVRTSPSNGRDTEIVEVEARTGVETVHKVSKISACEYDADGQLYALRNDGPANCELVRLYPRTTGKLDEVKFVAGFPGRNFDSFGSPGKDNSWWFHANSYALSHYSSSGKKLGELPDGVAYKYVNTWQQLPNGLVALVGQEGNVEFWRADQHEPEGQLTLLDDAGKNWLATSRAGLFDGTTEAENNLEWMIGAQRFRVEQFFKEGYRPGLIRDFYRGARVGKVPGPLTRVHQPPKLEIVSPLPGSRLEEREAEVAVRVVDQGDGAAGTRLYINGHAVTATRTRSSDKDLYVFKVRLQPGSNEIRAIAYDGSGQVEARGDKLRLTCTAAARREPVLHVLAVGVNSAAAGRALQFAESDARSFAERLKSDLYSETQVHVLTGTGASKAAVDKEMRALELACEPQDTLVVFFAGHGVAESETYRFLLSGRDAQSDSMTSLELASYLETIPAYKQFVVLDTCHSAAASPDLAARFAVSQQRMARGSGTFLLAACRGNETAAEIPSLKHGLLTYALLNGFGAKGGARNKDGQVTVNSLIQYVSSEFPEVSRRFAQNQELYQFSNGADFVLTSPARAASGG